MKVSKMSVTRCLDELEVAKIDVAIKQGRTRCFVWKGSYEKLFQAALPFMRTPLYKEINPALKSKEIAKCRAGGISALSQYSMITDHNHMTYAVSKKEAKMLEISNMSKMPKGEVPEAVVQVMQYILPYGKKGVIDPLSIALALQEESRYDVRIEKEVEKMLKRFSNNISRILMTTI